MTGLRRAIEAWLGVEPVTAGEDTQWRLRANLGWPDWVVFLFFAVAIVAVLTIYLREGTGARRTIKLFLAGVRLAIITLVVMMLAGVEVAIDRTGLPYLILMVDDSESMSVKDKMGESTAEGEPTRLERATRWLAEDEGKQLQELTKQHKIQLYATAASPRLLGTAIKPTDVPALLEKLREQPASGAESRLGSNLRTVLNGLRGTPPSAVVIATDGVTTDGEPLGQAGQAASRKNIPVYSIGVGDPRTARDLELHDLLVDNVVFVDDLVSFEAKLTGRGFEGQSVEVKLRRKGSPDPLDTVSVKVGADGKPAKVRLSHRPTEKGKFEYTLDVAVAPRERQRDNNQLSREVTVIKEKIRVLYVESYPRYEFRFLKSLLEREPTIELGVILLDADPEHTQQDRAALGFFPTTKKDLYSFDVVILGDVAPNLFTAAQLETLRDFVKVKGGGLLFLSGEQFAPATYGDTTLADLLPVELGSPNNRDVGATSGLPFIPRLTVEGRASPIFRFAADETENDRIWANLPPMYWHARVEKAKPGAAVLAEYPGEARGGAAAPLVAVQFFGAGRSYFQAFDSTWRWRYRVEDLYFSRYWVQAIRYLSRSKLLGKNRSAELLVDRQRVRRGDPVQLRVRFLDESLAPRAEEGVTVTVEHEKLGARPLTLKSLPGRPSVFEGSFGQTADGKYRVRMTSPVVEGAPPAADFLVVPPPGELDRTELNEPGLRELAELTNGKYFPFDDAKSVFGEIPPGRRVALHTDPPIPLWNTWPVLLLFVGLLATEWIVRKVHTMV